MEEIPKKDLDERYCGEGPAFLHFKKDAHGKCKVVWEYMEVPPAVLPFIKADLPGLLKNLPGLLENGRIAASVNSLVNYSLIAEDLYAFRIKKAASDLFMIRNSEPSSLPAPNRPAEFKANIENQLSFLQNALRAGDLEAAQEPLLQIRAALKFAYLASEALLPIADFLADASAARSQRKLKQLQSLLEAARKVANWKAGKLLPTHTLVMQVIIDLAERSGRVPYRAEIQKELENRGDPQSTTAITKKLKAIGANWIPKKPRLENVT